MVYSYAQIDCWQVRWCWCCWCRCQIRTQSSRGLRSSLMQMLEMAAKIRTKALEGCQPGSSKTVWNGWRTMSGLKFLTATVFRPINVRTSYSCLAWPTVVFDWVCGSWNNKTAIWCYKHYADTRVQNLVQHKVRFV